MDLQVIWTKVYPLLKLFWYLKECITQEKLTVELNVKDPWSEGSVDDTGTGGASRDTPGSGFSSRNGISHMASTRESTWRDAGFCFRHRPLRTSPKQVLHQRRDVQRFKTCPKGAKQFYTVKAFVNGEGIPVASILLPNKKKKTYAKMWKVLRTAAEERWIRNQRTAGSLKKRKSSSLSFLKKKN